VRARAPSSRHDLRGRQQHLHHFMRVG
jgi:hypothetical protein